MSSKTISTILNLKDNFSETIKKTTASTAAFAKGIKQSETTVSQMKSGVTSAFTSIGDSIKNGIGLGAGIDIWNSAKEDFSEMLTFGSDLQKSLNGIQTATGYNNDAMSDMKDVMLGIYNDNFGENFEDIADAVKSIGQQTGVSSTELKGLTEDALLIRDTFKFDVSESIRSVNMLMNQFKMSGDGAYNLIAQGAQYGLDKNGDLLDSINEYSVQFNQAGFSADEMFNMLVNGSAGGTFSVDKLGDAVKEFSIRSKDGSKSTMGAFQSLGLDANKLSQQFAQGGDVGKQAFTDVNTKLLDMKDPLQQNQIGVALWGSMWEDLGVSGIKALTNTKGEISTTNDALKDINKVQYDDLGSAFEGIKRNITTGVLLPISDKVLPKLNDFGNWFTSNIPSIKEKISGAAEPFIDIGSSIIEEDLPALKDLIDAGGNLADTIFNSVKPAMDEIVPDNWNSVSGAIKDILTNATDTVNYIKDNWSTIGPIVGGIVIALGEWKAACIAVEIVTGAVTIATGAWGTIELMIWGIKNATTAWEAAQWALNVAMDANAIGAVILVVTALGYAIYEVVTHFKDICEWVEKAWNWLTKWNSTEAEDKDVTVYQNTKSIVDEANNKTRNTSFGHNATGTQFWKGGQTVVGEHGEELIDLPSGSKVYTARQTKNMLNGNGGHIFNINFNGNVGTEEFFNKAGKHIVNEVILALDNM